MPLTQKNKDWLSGLTEPQRVSLEIEVVSRIIKRAVMVDGQKDKNRYYQDLTLIILQNGKGYFRRPVSGTTPTINLKDLFARYAWETKKGETE